MGAPSFPTYQLDTIKTGATPVVTPLRDGAFDTGALAAAVSDATRIVFVCNPNNPTGGIVTADELRALVDAVSDRVLIVVDEAYAEYVSDPAFPETITEHVMPRPNVVVLRTFSKIFGLAGLRIGYLIGQPDVVDAVGRVRHYYDVCSLAQLAAIASLDDPGEVERRRGRHGDRAHRAGSRAQPARAAHIPGPRQLRRVRTRRRGGARSRPPARGRAGTHRRQRCPRHRRLGRRSRAAIRRA